MRGYQTITVKPLLPLRTPITAPQTQNVQNSHSATCSISQGLHERDDTGETTKEVMDAVCVKSAERGQGTNSESNEFTSDARKHSKSEEKIPELNCEQGKDAKLSSHNDFEEKERDLLVGVVGNVKEEDGKVVEDHVVSPAVVSIARELSPRARAEVEAREQEDMNQPVVEELLVYTDEMALFHRHEITSPRCSFNLPSSNVEGLVKRPNVESVDSDMSPRNIGGAVPACEGLVYRISAGGTPLLRIHDSVDAVRDISGQGKSALSEKNEPQDPRVLSYDFGRISPTPCARSEEARKCPDLARTNDEFGGNQSYFAIPKISDLLEEDGEDIEGVVMMVDGEADVELDTHRWGYSHHQRGYELASMSGLRMMGCYDGIDGVKDEAGDQQLLSPVLNYHNSQEVVTFDDKGSVQDGEVAAKGCNDSGDRKVTEIVSSTELNINGYPFPLVGNETVVDDQKVLDFNVNDCRDKIAGYEEGGVRILNSGSDDIAKAPRENNNEVDENGEAAEEECLDKVCEKLNPKDSMGIIDERGLVDGRTLANKVDHDLPAVKTSEHPVTSSSSGATSPAIRECTTGVRVTSRDSLTGLAPEWDFGESRSSSEDVGELKTAENHFEKLAMDNISSALNPAPVIKESDSLVKPNASLASKLKSELANNESSLLPSMKNSCVTGFPRPSVKQQKLQQQEFTKQLQEEEGRREKAVEQCKEQEQEQEKRKEAVQLELQQPLARKEQQKSENVSSTKSSVSYKELRKAENTKPDENHSRPRKNRENDGVDEFHSRGEHTWMDDVVRGSLTMAETKGVVHELAGKRTEEDKSTKPPNALHNDCVSEDGMVRGSKDVVGPCVPSVFIIENVERSSGERGNYTRETKKIEDVLKRGPEALSELNSHGLPSVSTKPRNDGGNNENMLCQYKEEILSNSKEAAKSLQENWFNEELNSLDSSDDESNDEQPCGKSGYRSPFKQEEGISRLTQMRVGSLSETSVRDLDSDQGEQEEQSGLRGEHWCEITQPKPPPKGNSKRCVTAR